MYQLTTTDTILRLADKAFIPPDPANRDYQQYLQWVSEGNQPEPADPIPTPEPLTPEQKLQNAGLTIDELKSLLGLN
jgi:hypothetical protein